MGAGHVRRRVPNMMAAPVAACALAGCEVAPWQEEPASFYAVNSCSMSVQVLGTTSKLDAGRGIPSTEDAIPPGERDRARSDFDLADADGALYIWVAGGDSKNWPDVPTARVELDVMKVDRTNPDWPEYTYEISGDLCPE